MARAAALLQSDRHHRASFRVGAHSAQASLRSAERFWVGVGVMAGRPCEDTRW